MSKNKQRKKKNKHTIILTALLAVLFFTAGSMVFAAVMKIQKERSQSWESTLSEENISGQAGILNETSTLNEANTLSGAEVSSETNVLSKADAQNEEATSKGSNLVSGENTAGDENAMTQVDKSELSTQTTEPDTVMPENQSSAVETSPSGDDVFDSQIEIFLSTMTLEEKIYQMFIVTPEQLTGVSAVTSAGDTTKEKLKKYPVGGLVYFSANLVSPDQTKKMLTDVQKISEEVERIPLFLCVDEEGGRVARVANSSGFSVDAVGSMSKVDCPEEAYACGDSIGAYLKELGFTVDFAPDADVITNSSNTVIGDRSFGTDADIVTEYAVCYANGLHAHDVLSTFKHFPGHGATEADTHAGYAYTNKSYEELVEAELKPFAAAQANGVDLVMAAHISLPNVIGDDTPCSLSYKMITEILRGELKYEGLVVTDALGMGAISEAYSSSSAAVKAVEAGVDLLLMPVDLQEAYAGIYEAVKNGEITEERIDESVRRILRKKIA